LVNDLGITPDKIIIHGRSLGGAIAIDLASRKPCAGLIVESSFVTAFRVLTAVPIYPFDRFNSLAKIGRINCPVLFIHGKRDSVVPFWHGEKLFATANEPKYTLWLEDSGHNDIFSSHSKDYIQAIKDFSATLSK
jgi:abhydrolase domain-containing protein 17